MNIPIDIHISMPEGMVTVHGWLENLQTSREHMTFTVQGRLRPDHTFVMRKPLTETQKRGWAYAQHLSDQQKKLSAGGRTLRQRRRQRQGERRRNTKTPVNPEG